MPSSREDFVRLDEQDPLASYRERFTLPDGVIYLDGNSLGATPTAVLPAVTATIEKEWSQDLIKSWTAHRWIDLPHTVGATIARLVGAVPEDVMVADSTTVNLFRVICLALAIRADRSVIVLEEDNFPADNYVAQGVAQLLGDRVKLRIVPGDAIASAVDQDVALVLASHVDFRTGRMLDMAAVTRAAHDHGALVLWDLSHSAGIAPLALLADDVDFAVGCGYKYLNGGPGAPAYLYVHKRWQDAAVPPFFGWLGHAAPFALEKQWEPASGIRRMLGGTPPILSTMALKAALSAFDGVDLRAVRTKSMALTSRFIELVDETCARFGVGIVTPRDEARRGSQVSVSFDNAYPAMQALIARGVIGDFRAPNLMRFGFAPLYVRYVDVWDAVACLQQVLSTDAWNRPEFLRRQYVT
ncbi:MAG: kynureninase [Polyangiaceae bacterium]